MPDKVGSPEADFRERDTVDLESKPPDAWHYGTNGRAIPHVRLIRDTSPGSEDIKRRLDEIGVRYDEYWARPSYTDDLAGPDLPSLSIPEHDIVFYGVREISHFFLDRFHPTDVTVEAQQQWGARGVK